MKTISGVLALACASCVLAQSPAQAPPAPKAPHEAPAAAQPAEHKPAADPYVLGHTMKLIDGTDQSLKAYEGKVVLIVNVASKCGYTPQYKDLEALYRRYKDNGLVILGFPANDFGNQEPGTDKEIAEFCSSKYQVSFPMFSKISVKGEKADPLFAQLAALPNGGEPKWNFTKYLVGKDGKLITRFETRVKPGEKGEMNNAVRGALGLPVDDAAPAKDSKDAAPAK